VAALPWYRNGLRFACTQCGRCCGGGPGTIRANEEEIAALAEALGLGDAAFRERYTRRLRDGDISLIEREDHDCIFYDESLGCTVYAHRPRQCRTWPFWRSLVRSPKTWAAEEKNCPGLNSGPLHSIEEIAAMIRDDGTSASRRRRTAAGKIRGAEPPERGSGRIPSDRSGAGTD
jgi:Fe-S-cluster containining protein